MLGGIVMAGMVDTSLSAFCIAQTHLHNMFLHVTLLIGEKMILFSFYQPRGRLRILCCKQIQN